MHRRHLKPLRVAVALSILAGLMAAFTDFRGLVPARLAHWLTAVQFTSALLALGRSHLKIVYELTPRPNAGENESKHVQRTNYPHMPFHRKE